MTNPANLKSESSRYFREERLSSAGIMFEIQTPSLHGVYEPPLIDGTEINSETFTLIIRIFCYEKLMVILLFESHDFNMTVDNGQIILGWEETK